MSALVEQPTAAPTRKMAAVGWTGVAATVIAAGVGSVLPDLSAACAEELSGQTAALLLGGSVGGASLLSFVSGYLRRERK